MTTLRIILASLILCAATTQAQTLRSLMYNTTNGQVVYSGTNDLNFPYPTTFSDDVSGNAFESSLGSNSVRLDSTGVQFSGSAAATTRTNLGLGATWLTNTDVTNFRTAIGLGTTNSVSFFTINVDAYESTGGLIGSNGISFEDDGQNITRTNLGLGGGVTTNITFVDAATNTNSVTISNGIITGWTQ